MRHARLAPGLLFCFLTVSVAANAQFRELGPAPITEPAARRQIKTLLEKVDPENRQQTIATISGLLPWYRDLADDELIAAWQGEGRATLPEVMEALADSRIASAIVEFSWRQGRQSAFKLAYAPMLEHLMARYPESAKPFLDDLRLSPDLPPRDAVVVCRILLDLRDVGTWKQSALQILPHYRRATDEVLAQDLHGSDKEKSYAAQRWSIDLRPSDTSTATSNRQQMARVVPPTPTTQMSAPNGRSAPNPSRPSLRLTAGETTLTPLNPATVDDSSASTTGVPGLIEFVNQSSTPVDIYWMNFKGDRVLYLPGLKVGASWLERTFTNHYWLVVASGTGGTTEQDTGTRLAAFQPLTPNAAYDPSKRDSAIISSSDTAAPAPVSSAGLTQPVVLTRVEPAFTTIARQLNVGSASVKLSVVVQPDGTVQDVSIVKFMGYGLEDKAIEAVRQWRFQPAMRAGVPVQVRTTVEFNFKLNQSPATGTWNSGPMVFALDAGVKPPVVTEGAMPRPAHGEPNAGVVLEFTVDPAGTVTNIHPLSGPAPAAEVLSRSLATWKFQPARKDNEFFEATGTVTFVERQAEQNSLPQPAPHE